MNDCLVSSIPEEQFSKLDAFYTYLDNHPDKIQDVIKLVNAKKEIKQLEKLKDSLTNDIKNMMISSDIDIAKIGNIKVSLSKQERQTVPASLKDKFVTELAGMGKNHLLSMTIEPNVEEIMEEVKSGMLDKSFVEKYINITPVVTLRTT